MKIKWLPFVPSYAHMISHFGAWAWVLGTKIWKWWFIYIRHRASSTCSVSELMFVFWFWFWFWVWSGSGLGLDLGLSWWVEAFLLGPTHFSPLLLALPPWTLWAPFWSSFFPLNFDTLQGPQKVEKRSPRLPKSSQNGVQSHPGTSKKWGSWKRWKPSRTLVFLMVWPHAASVLRSLF